MKTTLKKAAFGFIFLFGIQMLSSAQTVDNIISSLRSGSASEIAKYFQPNVALSLQDGANSYSKSQAEQVLTNFFSKHAFRSYTVVHQGTSPEGAKYVIGTLATSDKTFRVYMYAATNANSLNIKELRFEEQ